LKVIPGYTELVKTAVSIPDVLFEAADRAARRLGLSRSELYARALERFLSDEPDDAITARLDDVYAGEASALDDELASAQRRAVAEPW
jgi:metal-responsive CopG/Arc/MetJ family transcriptional regulator